jgi:predicted transposase YbfD/YdcC
LTIAVTALLMGQRSLRAIGQWSKKMDADTAKRLRVGSRPEESTIRRVLGKLDPGLLDGLLGAFTWLRCDKINGQVVVSFDGKAIRGAKKRGARAAFLVEAMVHGPDVVIAQQGVDDKSSEIPTLTSMLKHMVITGVLVVADALHTQVDTARKILAAGGHYLFCVKGNQPGLLKTCKAMPWGQVPVCRTTSRWGGGQVTRSIRVIAADQWINRFPGAAQIAQLTRTRVVNGKRHREVVYLICSLGAHQATPVQITAWINQHWHIELRVHYVKDVTMGEDAHAGHTGMIHHVLASLRNLVLNLFRIAGYSNIAEVQRDHAYDRSTLINTMTTRTNN